MRRAPRGPGPEMGRSILSESLRQIMASMNQAYQRGSRKANSKRSTLQMLSAAEKMAVKHRPKSWCESSRSVTLEWCPCTRDEGVGMGSKHALATAVVGLGLAAIAVAQDQEDYTYKLTQSTASFELWTTPPSERVFVDDVVPTDTASGVKVYAARNEFEPFLVVVKPASSGTVAVSISAFGSGIAAELYQVEYVTITQVSDSLGRLGPYPDPLWPLANGATIDLVGGVNTALWVSLYVPDTVAMGDHGATLQIGGLSVPVTLHVFDFNLSPDVHIRSQMNVSHQAFLDAYGVACCEEEYWTYVEAIKQLFIDHRLTPKSVLWSGGLTSGGGAPYIDYDCAGTLSDPHGIWGFDEPAARYLDGIGLMQGTFTDSFNGGTGFPSFMAMTFSNNNASADQRPAEFCGHSRSSGDWYTANNPTSPYNQEWFEYVAAIASYLTTASYLDKAYYYFANEPQDQAGYDAVAWYSRHLRAAAPGLELMVSEEPKPEIFGHSDYVADGQIDIWLAVLHAFDPAVSAERESNHGEESWIYFLYGTRPPYFNPITLDHPGVESKLTGWFLWTHRVRGLAYYAINDWSQNPWTDPLNSNHNGDLFMLYPPSKANLPIAYGANDHRFVPSIRFELMRDGLEDYEYLRVLAGNTDPVPGVANAADIQADKIITGVASYTRNGEFMYNLRRLIGLKNGGEIAVIPDIEPPVEHPRAAGDPGNYHINFQDPYDLPATTYTEDTYGNGHVYRYVTYAGHDYLQVGTEPYHQTAGFGWLDDTTNFLAGRDPWGDETDERKITYVYDNWAHHPSIFEFDLPNGTYNVEVSVGTPRTVRTHNRVVIEGVVFIDDEPSDFYIVRSLEVVVTDSKLTVDIGIWDEYTMINYLDILTLGPPSAIFADGFESGDPSRWTASVP